MSSSNALLPIVVGVGLAVLSGGALAERRGDRDRPRWDATLFFFLAVQLIGFCVVGAALYVLGWSIETSQPLGPQDLRAEKHFIMALLLLFVITAIFKTWTQNVESPAIQPWERGYADRAAQLLGFTMALLVVVLVGLGVEPEGSWHLMLSSLPPVRRLARSVYSACSRSQRGCFGALARPSHAS